MRRLALLSALLASSFSVCSVAQHTQYATVVAKPDVRTKVVSYGDLNLQRHEGVKILYRRIQTAASLVCTAPNMRSPQVAMRLRECALDATTRAVRQVGVPALMTLHAANLGQDLGHTVALRSD
jgi:UrcA family protein